MNAPIFLFKVAAFFTAACVPAAFAAQVFEPVPEVPEGFKAEYSPAVADAPNMRGMNLVSCFKYDEKDIADLASWNANLIRWQISRNYRRPGENRDKADYDRWIGGEIAKLKTLAGLARKYGMKIVAEMHTPTGGVDRDNNMMMFYEPEYAEHFVEVWKRLAWAFKGEDAIFAYDIINEPVQYLPNPKVDYLKLQYAAAKAIREIDPDKPLVVASDNWNNPVSFKYLKPFPMKDVLYSVHMYRPHEYTHQGIQSGSTMEDMRAGRTVKYPSEKFSKADIARELKPVTDFEDKYGAKIFLGEFGLVRWAPNGGRYLRDCMKFFESRGWSWANHAFRETYDGFSSEHSDDVNEKEKDLNNPRLKALLKGFSKNSRLH